MHRILAFDICSVSLLVILFSSLFVRKMTKGRSNIMFLSLVSLVLVSAFSDIIRCLIIEYGHINPVSNFFAFLFNYIYFYSRCLTPSLYLLYVYSANGLWHDFKTKPVLKYTWCFFTFIIIVFVTINLFVKKIFIIDDSFTYLRGPWINYLYLLILGTMLYSIVSLLFYRKMMQKNKFLLLFSLYPISILGIFIQMKTPEFMVEIFTTSFPLLLISLLIQRPEEMVNQDTGALNYYECIDEVSRNILAKRNMKIVFIKILNQKNIKNQVGIDQFHVLLRKISKDIYSIIGIDEIELYYLEVGAFAVVSLKNKDDLILEKAEKICSVLREKQTVNNLEVILELKICIVRCPNDINEINTLVNFGNDFHHIISKTNQVTQLCEESTSKEFEIRSNIDEVIKKAITNKSFEMYYQPIYNVEKKKFTCAEALIRLNDDKYGFISPAIFIPAAERSGAIHVIGDNLFEDVCKFVSECDFEELGLEYIQVNLSVSQCIETDLSGKIMSILEKYGIDVTKINLEITENAADFNPEVSDKNINKLFGNGIDFSLDDYGTGYSNLRRVINLPFNLIKLDRNFSKNYSDVAMSVLISNTVEILKRLNKKVLIEGVEDGDALNYFVDAGCDFIQGYVFSKPLPKEEFIQFIKERNE